MQARRRPAVDMLVGRHVRAARRIAGHGRSRGQGPAVSHGKERGGRLKAARNALGKHSMCAWHAIVHHGGMHSTFIPGIESPGRYVVIAMRRDGSGSSSCVSMDKRAPSSQRVPRGFMALSPPARGARLPADP